MMRVPFAAPCFDGNEAVYLANVLHSTWITRGKQVELFEERMAYKLDVAEVVAVSSGTAALHLALLALGVGAGDEVIVPTSTFIATANAVRYTGATVVFADIDEKTWCLDVSHAAKLVTTRTKAIIPVHLYGALVDMDSLRDLALEADLHIVEDAAQAMGARYRTAWAGTIGEVGCFSLYANKLITTGEGGLLVTNDARLAATAKKLHGQGQAFGRRYWHDMFGYNYRMTDLQGAIGLAQLERIDTFFEKRWQVLKWYREYLKVGCIQRHLQNTLPGCWAFGVLFEDSTERMRVENALLLARVETRPFFPPIHTMPMYKNGKSLPVSEDLASRGLVLPIHARMVESEVKDIAEIVNNAI